MGGSGSGWRRQWDPNGRSSRNRRNGFSVPPYVAHRGWIGVLLNKGLSHEELADLIEDAYRTVAPAKYAAILDNAGERDTL